MCPRARTALPDAPPDARPEPFRAGRFAGRCARRLHGRAAGDWVIEEKVYRANAVIPPHEHDFSNLSLVLAGGLQEKVGRDAAKCSVGSWVRKPAGVVHADRFGPRGARLLEMRWIAKPGTPPPFAFGWHHGGPEVAAWLRIYRELRLGDADGMLTIAELAADLGTQDAIGRESRAVLPWMDRIVERLRAIESGSASLAELSREVGIHPTYVARAFRRRFGVTIGEYSRAIRIGRAAAAIAARRPLAEAALAAGFADQPHLCRVFKTFTGMSPGTYRRLVLGDGAGRRRDAPRAAGARGR